MAEGGFDETLSLIPRGNTVDTDVDLDNEINSLQRIFNVEFTNE